jgi:DNA-binding transcriptional MerR regulator
VRAFLINVLVFDAVKSIVLSMTIIMDQYSAERARVLCGFKSVAMIDYLQRSGVFVPRGRKEKRKGKGRRFEFRDLIVLKAIKRLLDSGASVANLKKSLAQFQKLHWSADPVTLEDSFGVIRYLVVSGESVFLKRDPNVLVDLSKNGQLSFSFIIDLDVLHAELRRSLDLPALHELQPEFELVAKV